MKKILWFKCTILLLLAEVNTLLHFPLWEKIIQEYRQAITDPEAKVQNQLKLLGEYDFIVVGAGPSGSALTNRLTEVPGWKVLLLEAGKDESAFTDIPLVSNYGQLTDYNWGYKTEPSDSACLAMKQNRCSWPRGKAVGGTSVLNDMINSRGNRHDYDDWEVLGNPGWGYDDLFPYFLKFEDMTIPELMNSTYHSTGGYLTVEKVTYQTPLRTIFLEAAKERGFEIGDYNGRTKSVYSHVQATTRKGARVSAAKAFLRPIRNRPNFHLAKRAQVTKVLIDPNTRRAYGVEYFRNGRVQTVKARKEVILSAGAINSPQLLMLSGIGPREHLEELGIPVLQDLKVGQNLQDHVAPLTAVFIANDTVSLKDTRLLNSKVILDYLVNHTGPLTIPGSVEGLGWEHTKYADHSKDRPDVEILLSSGCISSEKIFPSLKLAINLRDEIYNAYVRSVLNYDTWCAFPIIQQPKSKGMIKLQSKNPFDAPLMYQNYFGVHQDTAIVIEGIKKIIELSKTNAFQKIGSKLYRTPVPGCEELEFGSDEYWECSIRHFSFPANHQCGTCKMGPSSDSDAVVSPELKVYGVEGLRVIDASIMPTIVSGHTTTPCYMIGEKGADLIKKAWRKL